MQRIPKTHRIYTMSSDHAPAATVDPNEPFCVELEDCYSGNLRTPADTFTKEMWDTVNPATGPVAIRGARPGDVLKVEILNIRTRDDAVMCVEHGAGALAEFVEGIETTILPIREGRLVVSETLSIPVNPMIGVIGVAPAGDPILNGTPGEHGGNMDCKLITAGTTLFLPVHAEGALLSLGDLHAVMGDGEVCLCGAETSGEVTLKASSLQSGMPTPCLETETHWHFIGSALTLDACEKIVLRKTHVFLTTMLGLSANAAARAMSLLGDLCVCQVVDPLKTMRFSLSKTVRK